MERALKKAHEVYKSCGTTNPFSIAEKKGYPVIETSMPMELRGFTTKNFRIPVIFINDNYSENDKEFTCLHEIGHVACGHGDNSIFLKNNTNQVINKYENEADDFACALRLLSFDLEDLKQLNIEQISSLAGIDETVLLNFFKRNRTNIRSLLNGGMYEQDN